jgi:HSP20 family molecular chaperone IbpA
MQRQLNRNMLDVLASVFGPETSQVAPMIADNALFSAAQHGTHRLFSEMFNNRQMATPWFIGSAPEPYVDILESHDAFRVKADVPGIEEENLNIAISDGALTISGTRCDETKEGDERYIRHECHSGTFSRTIALPEEADMDSATAELEHNVLSIRIPKKAAASHKNRRVRVQSMGQARQPELVTSKKPKSA